MKMLAGRHPTVAWSLCMAVLEPLGMMIPHARPDFLRVQAFEPDVTAETFTAQRRTAIEILVDLAGRSGSKWSQLVDGIMRLDDEERLLLLGRLETADIDDPTPVWDQLRKSISLAYLVKTEGSENRSGLLPHLERLLNQFAPHDPVARIAYLFDGLPDLCRRFRGRLPNETGARDGSANGCSRQRPGNGRSMVRDRPGLPSRPRSRTFSRSRSRRVHAPTTSRCSSSVATTTYPPG